MPTLWQDIRYGLRILAKNPGFTAITVLTLALGIGANSGIFSVMRQVLLQRLPVPRPQELVLLYGPGPRSGHVSSDEGDGSESFSYPMYKDLREHSTVFAGLAAKADFPLSVGYRGETERAEAELVSGNYFETLGVQPALGRLLQPSDEVSRGVNPVVVLGYGYWQKRFGGRPGILNQSVQVNNRLMTVVGVVQLGFDGIELGRISQVYLPITLKPIVTPTWDGLDNHLDYWVKLIGRLKSGVSQAQASAALAPTYRALLENELLLVRTHLDDRELIHYVTQPLVLHSGARGRPLLENDTRPKLLTLMGMVGLVMFITCANVAGLLTARGAARQKEISVRFSLGASRLRIVRQLVVEACLLSFTGAGLGLLIASWLSFALVRFAADNMIADGLSASLNIPVLAFTLVLALFCGILFGIAPAIGTTRVHLTSTLKEQAGSLSSGLAHARMRKALVVCQVAFTLLLATSAWGFVRSLYNLQRVNLGLRTDHVLQFSIAPDLNGYDPARSLGLYRQLKEKLGALPGVVSVSATEEPLIADSNRGGNVTVEGEPADLAGTRHIMLNAVSPGHFANLGVPLLQGREFTAQDGAEGAKVAIINQAMVKEFFPDGRVVGKRLMRGGGKGTLDTEIVGVVQDSHHSGVKERLTPFLYIPVTQEQAIPSLSYYVRTTGDPLLLANSVRAAIAELDSSLPIYDVRSFAQQVDLRLSGDRLLALLALTFGALAALLAALGIYGLLSYTVTQRTREIGVRMALGAEPKRVGWMISGDVARLLGLGILVGLPLAHVFSRLVGSMLYGVQAFGVSSIGISLLALAQVAVLATFMPARRATKIDPMAALRYE